MGKKQWAKDVEEIEDRILELLRPLQNAALTQYRDLFFKIFRDAYERGYCCSLRHKLYVDTGRIEWIRVKGKPYISGESIWSYAVRKGWVTREEEGRRYEQLRLVRDWWDAWTYALESIGYKQSLWGYVEKDPHGDKYRGLDTIKRSR